MTLSPRLIGKKGYVGASGRVSSRHKALCRKELRSQPQWNQGRQAYIMKDSHESQHHRNPRAGWTK